MNNVKAEIIQFAKKMKPNVEDFGDYVPFLAYLGENRLCDEHLRVISSQICQPVLPTDREDTLLGLIELYRWTSNKESLKLAEKYVDYLLSHFYHDGRIAVRKDQFLREVSGISKRNPLVGMMIRLAYARSFKLIYIPRNGLYIELLVDLYEATGERRYLDIARNMAYRWLADKTFQKSGLFERFRFNPFGKHYALLSKDNTNLVHGLVSLYSATRDERIGDAVKKWFESIHTRFPKGLVPQKIYLDQNNGANPDLISTHSLLEVLCDASKFMSEEGMLSYAEKICSFWLNLQSERGLLPINPESNISWQDSVTDFSIVLWRLFELTDNDSYRIRAEAMIKGLLENHVFPIEVDFRTGEVIDSTIVDKYVFLMLKPIILLETGSVYKDRKIYKLLRDR